MAIPRRQAERRPYAATANVTAVLERARSRNLPEAINNDFFRLCQMPEVVYGRVTEALTFLDLIEEDGRPTDKLSAIARAPDTQYHDLLADCIRDAYRDDFNSIDPSADHQNVIIDQFRRYEPRSQTSRMVMLFLGLCRYAGIPVLDAPRERRQQPVAERTTRRPAATPRRQSINGGSNVRRPGNSRNESQDGGTGSLLFGLTVEDAALLSDTDFSEVWAALGKVALAKARAQQRTAVESAIVQEAADEDNEAH